MDDVAAAVNAGLHYCLHGMFSSYSLKDAFSRTISFDVLGLAAKLGLPLVCEAYFWFLF